MRPRFMFARNGQQKKLKLVLIFMISAGAASASAGSYPGYDTIYKTRDEIAFCPAGGPTGWMNHFDRKSRQKRHQNYMRYMASRQQLQHPYPAKYMSRYPAYHGAPNHYSPSQNWQARPYAFPYRQ